MGVSAGAGAKPCSADFVGRAADLQFLRRAMDDALSGIGSLVFVSGEPGIGKTRLGEEIAAYASQAGAAVARAAGWEGEGAPAFWPWIQVIRAYAAQRDPDDMATALGPYARDVVRLVPELSDAVPGLRDAAVEGIGEQPRFALFDAVASFFRRSAASVPALLIFDDLQWADVGSLMLTRFCGRELRESHVLIVGAFRDDEVDRSTELGRVFVDLQQAARTLLLDGLEVSEVRDLLARSVGHHEAERLAPDVHRRSGGNPLFVLELGRLLAVAERSGLGAVPSIPDSIGAVLDRRLSRLSSEAADVLSIGAVVGEEFGLDVLERASGYPRERLLELLDEAMRGRLIREDEESVMRLAFVHALVRDCVYQRLSLGDRAGAHRRVALALEELYGTRPPYAEIAHHYHRAALDRDDRRAVDYAERAGRQAFDQFAYEDAAGHFARALDALPEGESDEDRARLLLAQGEARLWAGDVPAAREAFEEAAALARRHRWPEVLAKAAVGFGAGLGGFEVKLLDRAQIDLLEEALGALGPADSAVRARAMALLSVALTFAERSERRLRLAEDAVAIARRVGDAAALVHALGAHCDAISGPDHVEQRLAESDEMIGVATAAGDHCGELLGRRHRLIALMELGDVAAADAEIDAYASTAEAVRQPLYLWYVPMWRGMRALMEGRIDEVRRRIDELGRLAARARSDNGTLLAEVLFWNCLREEGRFRETGEVLREQLKLTVGVPSASFWLGLCVPSEYPEKARAAVARLAADEFAEFERNALWLTGMSGVADACHVVRDASAAEKAYAMLLPYGARFALDGTATACYGAMWRYLGLMAAVLGRREDAASHFEEALSANRRAGAPLLVAHTLFDFASMLLEAGEGERAKALLAESLETYRELGVRERAVRVEAALSSVGIAGEPASNAFRLEGNFWTLTYAGRTTRLKDAKGLRDIAVLIKSPGRELHVADLIAATEGAPADRPSGPLPEGVAITTGSADPILDERARAAYRRRLEELREELDDAERFSDVVRAERARAEMDFVAGELASALGLGGRPRMASDAGERARKAVAQRVRNALRRIKAEHPQLGHHLDRSLRMGRFCCYAPEQLTTWDL